MFIYKMAAPYGCLYNLQVVKILAAGRLWMRHPALSVRCFAISHSNSASGKEQRRHNKFNVLLNRKVSGAQERKRKKTWYETPAESTSLFTAHAQRKISAGSQRRAQQLSVVLYEYVTSLINSGEVEPRLQEMGFHVEKVHCVADMSHINVHWMAMGTSTDQEIEALLPSVTHELRTALVSLNIMGNLPAIHFVKDLSAARMQEVERLLAQADLGPDYECTPLGQDMKSVLAVKAEKTLPSLQEKFAQISHKFILSDSERLEGGLPATDDSRDHARSILSCDRLHETGEDLHSIDQSLRSDMYSIDHKILTQKLLNRKIKARRTVQDPVEVCSPDLSKLYKSLPKVPPPTVKVKTESRQKAINREVQAYHQAHTYTVNSVEEEENFDDDVDIEEEDSKTFDHFDESKYR